MRKVFLLIFALVVLQAALLEAARGGKGGGKGKNGSGKGGQTYGGKSGGSGHGKNKNGRNRRDLSEIAEFDETEEPELRLKRSWAPGGQSFPSQGSNKGQSSGGSWSVTTNKDKGRGPQIRTEAQGNVYNKGGVRVDAQGHHEFGKGRKPSYGGSVSGRWRRDTEEIDELVREKRQLSFMPNPQPQRFPQPTQGDRGSIGVTVNRDQGRGPQIRTEAQGNIYTSPNGNWRVDGNGYHEAGRGRKPDYGGQISVTGRFRRDLEAEETEIDEDIVEREKRSLGTPNPKIIKTVYVRPYKPKRPIFRKAREIDEEDQIEDAEIREKRSIDRRPQWPIRRPGPKPWINRPVMPRPYIRHARDTEQFENHEIDNIEGAEFETEDREKREVADFEEEEFETEERQKRDIEETEEKQAIDEEPEVREKRAAQNKGSVKVSVNKDQGRGPQVRTDAKTNIYTSKNGNWRVDGGGYHEAGRGRKPDYGGHISVSGRFRRDIEAEEELTENREKRQTKPGDRGSVQVSVNKDKGSGPQIRTDAQYNIYKKNNWEISGQGHHEAGRGRKPSYGGGISVIKRF